MEGKGMCADSRKSMSDCGLPDSDEARRKQIQALYTELAERPHKDFGCGKGKENAHALGYSEAWLARLPDEKLESILGPDAPLNEQAV